MDTQQYATDIVKKLVKAGHTAYFAGGWVRDHLMEHPSNDIDIATDASPDKILDLFPRTIPIGLAFGVVIVLVDGKQFEVSTFRKDLNYVDGRRPEQVEYSTAQEDAKRRDFTINGMFYDPLEHVIHDFVGGAQDIKKQTIRAIGDPYERFTEDRLRLIRAVRFAARFGFKIDPETEEAIVANADQLFPAVAMERVWQEFTKMSTSPRFGHALLEMQRLNLLSVIFPSLQGVGLHKLKKYVESFDYFPEGTPTILYLLELFPEMSVDKLVDIGRYLKISNRDIKLVELISMGRQLNFRNEIDPKEIEDREWVYFYAHPDSDLCLNVIAARLSKDEKDACLLKHQERKLQFKPHIERIQLGKPLVTAALLQAHGVLPGKPMGILLKEAERMVINHNRESADEIVEKLKQTPLWPMK